MYIPRQIEQLIKKSLSKNKIIVLYGARQVGKTTLLKNVFPKTEPGTTYLACDEVRIQEQLVADSLALKRVLGESGLVIFDEKQSLPNPGHILKIIADYLPNIKAIATGSASFDLANKIAEPLTGRHAQFLLYPFSFAEIADAVSAVDLQPTMRDCLIYGSYPAVFNAVEINDKIKIITVLADNYLYKDILSFDLIRNSHKVRELLIAISLQLGHEVSYHELSQKLGLNYKTVERYLDLLEKSFVLFRLYGFSRNLRNEITRKVKIYFYDCGIRNALINNYNPLNQRTDSGALFENYIIAERMKQNSLAARRANLYFWRTHAGQEIDLIAEKDGRIEAHEIKLTKPARSVAPAAFSTAYPNSSFAIVSLDHWESVLSLLA